MDEKENIIKYYSKTGESLTNLTGFSFDTRVGATANAFVLLKFSIKEPLQLQLPYQKINYYFTLICVTSLSCEKVHRTFSTAIRLRESEINFVFCEWELYVCTAPEQKTENAKDGKDSMSLPSFQSLRVQQVAPTVSPVVSVGASALKCRGLHRRPAPFAREAKGLFNSGSPKSAIFSTRRGLAALSKSKNSVSCETLHILDTRVGATANAFVLLKFSIKELLQLQQRMLRLRQPSGCCPYR